MNKLICPFCGGREIKFNAIATKHPECNSQGVGYCSCVTCLARGPYVIKQNRADNLETLAIDAWNGNLNFTEPLQTTRRGCQKDD